MKRKTKLLIRDAFFSTILSCLILALLSIAFVNIRFFNPLHKALKDFSFLDVYYSQKFDNSNKVNKDIVLVNVENHDRDGIALLLESVLKADPKVVGFDIILETHESHNGTDSLLQQLLQHKKVVTSMNINNGEIFGNDPFFQNDNEAAYVNFDFNDEEGVIREFIGTTTIKGKKRTSFATRIAQKFLKNKTWDKRNYDALLERSQVINYVGNSDRFLVLTLDDFLLGGSKKILKDHIVIMGYLGDTKYNSKYDIQDKKWTPLNERIAGKSDRDMYGVVIHANIVNMLVKNKFIHKVSPFWLAVITFFAMYVSTIVYMKLNKTYKISYRTRKQTYQFVVSLVLLLLVFWLLKNDIILSPFIIIIGILLAGSYFKYYKHLTRYINTKRKWKTYLK